MSAWIMGIVGVICLGVLLDIIVPEGEINKYIRGIFSIVTVVAIIAPIPKLINKDFDIGDFFTNGSQYTVNQDYVDNVESQYKSLYERNLTAAIEAEGVKGAKTSITYAEGLAIEKVDINLASATYPDGVTESVFTEKLKKAAVSALKIKSERVNVYGFRN